MKKKGITSTVVIENDIVTKTIDYNDFNDELLDREVYWLKKLEKHNIAPRFIKKEGNSIKMSYCGEPLKTKDLLDPEIQVQLIILLGILFKNYCFYNDFKLDNFTIKDGKLYIIDFGWCPVVKEDYTCRGTVQSNLVKKPGGNYFTLFEALQKNNNSMYLNKDTYFDLAEKFKGINFQHWKTSAVRWEYHEQCVRLLKQLNFKSILEAGTMGISLLNTSDTIDYDLPKAQWKLCYTPTYHHNLKTLPWPIKDKQYDIFAALRVFHHFGNSKLYFDEMKRISKNIILALPNRVAESYKKLLAPDYQFVCKDTDTIILHWNLE